METNGKEVAVKVENNMSFDQMKERASLLVKSGFLPSTIKTTEQALTIMMTGYELGLGFMESLRSINVVSGKPCMSAQLLLGLCYRTKKVEQAYFEKQTPTEVIFVLKRQGEPAYRSVWTTNRANALGLLTRDNWQKQPQTMLQWRSISEACRVKFPDAICGLYTPEEVADGVDLVESPSGEIKVETIQEKPISEAAIKAEEIKDEIVTEGANGLTNPMEVDKLGSYYLKPPYDKNFPDKCIMEIYGTTTPAGKPKGSIFLEMISKHSRDAEEKAIVGKFLELMAKPV